MPARILGMKKLSISAAILLAFFQTGWAQTGFQTGEQAGQTGFQKTMQTVGHVSWKATKVFGFGLGYLTEKIGQGVSLIGRGVAASGGALEKVSKH